MRCFSFVLIVAMCLGVRVASAELDKPPTGAEIAKKAKGVKLERNLVVGGEIDEKTIRFIPADLQDVKTDRQVEDGLVIGRLVTEVTNSDEVKLPPGQYTLYMAKVQGKWHVYAEQRGEIVGELDQVTYERNPDPGHFRRAFHYEGRWWIKMWFFFFCLSFGGG